MSRSGGKLSARVRGGLVVILMSAFAVLGPELAYRFALVAWRDPSLLTEARLENPAVSLAASATTGRPIVSRDPLYAWTAIGRWAIRRASPSLPQVVAYQIASCHLSRRTPLVPTGWDRLVLGMWLTRNQDLEQMLATLLKVCHVRGSDESILDLAMRIGTSPDPRTWTLDQAALFVSLALSGEAIDPACRPLVVKRRYVATRSTMCAGAAIRCEEVPWAYDFGPCRDAQ